MIPLPPSSTLFPYTTLFRSEHGGGAEQQSLARNATISVGCACRHGIGPLAATGCSSVARIARSAIQERRASRSEEHTSELQSRFDLVCRLLLEKKKKNKRQ